VWYFSKLFGRLEVWKFWTEIGEAPPPAGLSKHPILWELGSQRDRPHVLGLDQITGHERTTGHAHHRTRAPQDTKGRGFCRGVAPHLGGVGHYVNHSSTFGRGCSVRGLVVWWGLSAAGQATVESERGLIGSAGDALGRHTPWALRGQQWLRSGLRGWVGRVVWGHCTIGGMAGCGHTNRLCGCGWWVIPSNTRLWYFVQVHQARKHIAHRGGHSRMGSARRGMVADGVV
jgi:hypothetical protein